MHSNVLGFLSSLWCSLRLSQHAGCLAQQPEAEVAAALLQRMGVPLGPYHRESWEAVLEAVVCLESGFLPISSHRSSVQIAL